MGDRGFKRRTIFVLFFFLFMYTTVMPTHTVEASADAEYWLPTGRLRDPNVTEPYDFHQSIYTSGSRRLAGNTGIQTADIVFDAYQQSNPNATAVVLYPGRDSLWMDSIVAVPFAHAIDAPMIALQMSAGAQVYNNKASYNHGNGRQTVSVSGHINGTIVNDTVIPALRNGTGRNAVLTDAVIDTLQSMRHLDTIYIVGGHIANGGISTETRQYIDEVFNARVVELMGSNLNTTTIDQSRQIYDHTRHRNGAIVVSREESGIWDGMSIVAQAARYGYPIFFVDDTTGDGTANRLNANVASELNRYNHIYVVGGVNTIADSTLSAIPSSKWTRIDGTGRGTGTRNWGTNRYASNLEVLTYFNSSPDHLFMANGFTTSSNTVESGLSMGATSYSDTVAGAIVAAQHDAGILLLRSGNHSNPQLMDHQRTYLSDNSRFYYRMTLLGGPAAIATNIRQSVEDLFGGTDAYISQQSLSADRDYATLAIGGRNSQSGIRDVRYRATGGKALQAYGSGWRTGWTPNNDSWFNAPSRSRTHSGTNTRVYHNGEYEVEVRDRYNGDNTFRTRLTVTGIDDVAPGMTVTQSATGWTNGNVTLTVRGTDSGSGVSRIRHISGGTVSGTRDYSHNNLSSATSTFTATQNGTYTFEVTDRAGNTTTQSITVNRIDKTAPNGTITGNPTSWQNTNATLTFNATDTGGSGVRRVRQSGGTWVNGSTTSRTVSSNGTYSFEVEDNAGNTRTVSATVNRIDKTLPNGTISGNPTSWQNTNATLTFKATDTGGSGVRRVRIAGGSWVNGSTTTQTATANGTYSFEVEDNAGNKRTVSATVNRIDKALPNGTITGNPTSWQNTNVTLTFNGTDSGGAGVRRVRQSGGSWVNGSTTSRTVSSNGTYSFEVEDNAGNTRTVSITVNRIDKTLPNGSITGNPTNWTNQNVTLTFNGADSGGAGVRRVRVAGGTWVNSSTTTQTVSSNGTYSFEVEDNAGNTRTVSATVNRIDKTLPNGAITGNPTSWQNTNATLTFNATDTGGSGVRRVRQSGGSWVNGSTTSRTVSSNGTYSFEVEDNAGNTRTVSVTVNRIDKTLPNGTISGNPTSWQNTNATLTFNATDSGGSGVRRVRIAGGSWVNGTTTSQTATANGTYSFEVEDNAGNKRTVSVTVNRIDKTLPNGTISGNPTSWTNQNVTLTFNGTDSGGSGVRRVRQSGGTWVNGTTTSQTATANGTYRFEVEDNAGNTQTVSVTVNRIDKALPNGTITGNPTNWTNQNVTLTFNGTDSGGSGVRRVRQSGGSWVNGSTTSRTVSSNGTYSFEVEDNAGNKRTVSVIVNRIDKTLPNASSSQSPTAWTNGDVTITWTASATGSPLKRIRTHNGSTWGAWSAVSGTTSSTAQTVTSNGTYRFQVEDQAGNVEEISRTVTNIDKALPNGTITGNPTSWTNQNVTLTFNATDTGGSGVRRVRQSGGTWVNGSTTSRTVSSNGTYSFEVEDNAGNTRTVSVTVNRIDKSRPTASSTQSPTAWTNGDVNITWNASATGSPLKRIRTHNGSTWGAWSAVSGTTSSTVQTVTSNGTYRFQVEDQAGNVEEISRTVTNIDKALPNGTITGNPTSWTNQNATLTFNATDTGGSGVRRVRIAGGSWVNGATTSRTVSSNGTYSFEVEDNAGNKRTVSVTVNRIDTTLPNASSSQSPTGWTNGNVTITWSATAAGGSPLQRVRTHNGSSWSGWTTISGTSRTQTQVVSSNGTYRFQVEDAAGNVREITRTVNNIDKGSPAIRSSQAPTAWTSGNVTLTLEARDYGETNNQSTHISGIASIQVRRPNGTTWSDTYGGASEKSPTYYGRTFTATENGTYTVTVTDRAGNTATHSHTVSNIDRTLPTGSTTRQTGWTNGDVWIDVTGRDVDAGLTSIKYVSGGSIVGDTEFTFNGETTNKTVRFIATQNDTYTFDIRDRAGNIRRVTQVVDTIDRTSPNGSTTQSPTNWINQDVVIRLAGGDTNNQGSRISGVERVRMRPVGATSWSDTRTITDSTESSPTFNPLNFTISDNGRYQFELRDRAGNTRMIEHTVSNIDRVAPDVSGTFSPNGWTNDTITITWNARRTGDPGAPLEAYRYGKVDGSWTSWQSATNENQINVAQHVSENGEYQFEVRDEAGNIGKASVTISQHDVVVPTGEITARVDRSERDDHIDYTSNELVDMVESNRVTVDVTGVEDLGISGVESIVIEEQHRIGYGGEWMTVNENQYDWPHPYNTTSQTYEIDVAHAQDTRFVLTVIDRAGNTSSRATSNVVRHSVLQLIDFKLTDVVNPDLTNEELADIRLSDLSDGLIELTAGTDVTFDVTYQLRHLDTVEHVSGNVVIETVTPDTVHTDVIDIDEPITDHNQSVTFTETFTVPQGAPRGSEVRVIGNLVAEMTNGTVHEITYPSTYEVGAVDNHIEEFFRFRIVR